MDGEVKITGAEGREVRIAWRKGADGETVVELAPTPEGEPLRLTVAKLVERIAKLADMEKATLLYRLG